MLAKEFICEKPVKSSWIVNISHNRPNKTVTMLLSSGRSYLIAPITRTVFDRWIAAPSKGQFFHRFIKGRYTAKHFTKHEK